MAYISNPIDFIKPSFDAIKVNFWSLVAAVVLPVAVVVAIGAGMLAAFFSGNQGISVQLVLGMALLLLAMLVLVAPAATALLLASAKGKKMTATEAFKLGPQYGLRVVGISVLTALAIIGGFILLFVPGLIFMAWFALSLYVAIDEDKGVIESMKRSKELVKGRVPEMWGLMFLVSAAQLLTLIPVLGPIAVAIFSVIMAPAMAIRYLQLKENAGKELPKIHPANYAVIVLALIASSVANRGGWNPQNQQQDFQQQIEQQLREAGYDDEI
jgi:hypothetical protein